MEITAKRNKHSWRQTALLRLVLVMAMMIGNAGVAWGQAVTTPTYYYQESFTSSSTTTGWSRCSSDRYTPTILLEEPEPLNYYLSVNQDET